MAGEVSQRLRQIKGKMEEAAAAAVWAVQEQIFDASQGMVPVDTGKLKGTGKQFKPTVSGNTVTGVISYGGAETKTKWHGIGYEILVHTPGTKFYGGVPYLEQPTLDAKGYALATMAAAWSKALS